MVQGKTFWVFVSISVLNCIFRLCKILVKQNRMRANFIHKEFRLNGKKFSDKEELIQFVAKLRPDMETFLKQWFDNRDHVIVKTSGSTGKPKDIRLKKMHMVNSAKATGKYFGLPERTTALLCMPVQYIAGKMMLVRAMILGWWLDVIEAGSNPLLGIDKEYDFSAMVPLQLFNSLDKISRIKKLIVGGGVVSHELEVKLQDVQTQIYATYGMTESITHIAIKALNTSRKSEFYTTLPGVKISNDSRGCLVIHAPDIAEVELVTNDLAEVKSEYEFRWLGRIDHVINSGGIKIIPEQVEQKLSKIIATRFFITSKPDIKLGERLVMIIEGNQQIFTLTSLKKLLPKYEIPKEIFYLDKFKETPTGKIDRKGCENLLF